VFTDEELLLSFHLRSVLGSRFKITWGLRAGYGHSGRIYDSRRGDPSAHRWMRERDARC